MATLVLGDPRRSPRRCSSIGGPLARAAGLCPAIEIFNLGESERDFRVPDGGIHRQLPTAVWHPTAALVVEIVSPGDESWQKLPFHAKHHVDEVLIVDPDQRTVSWLGLCAGEYRPIERSEVIEFGPAALAAESSGPKADDSARRLR